LNDNGSIIFNGSVHNYLGLPGYAAYAAAKGGLVSMARIAVMEHWSRSCSKQVLR
jgi:NAD(P)-dependent dehydrogenase (short-subunit alcohol dehydrogenase family)